MATNIPPHNLGEVIDACVALIDDPALDDRRSHQHHSGTGFSDRRHHPRTPGHSLGLSSRPRLDRDARQGDDRDHPQGPRSDHHLGNSVPGEQGHHGRAHRRTGAREEDRGHFRSARRIRPRRLSRRRRAEARRGAGSGAEPALPLHAAADQFRRQHGGAGCRPSAGDEPEGPADAVHRLPRAGGHAPHQVPAQQGARPRPYPGRPCDRGRQYRRDHPRDPHLARSQHRARHPDVARLAGQGRRGDDHADRRSAPPARRRRHRAAVARAGQGHSRPAPAAPDGARPRGNFRRTRQAGGGNRRLSRHPALARPRPDHHQGRTCRREDRNSPRRARP